MPLFLVVCGGNGGRQFLTEIANWDERAKNEGAANSVFAPVNKMKL